MSLDISSYRRLLLVLLLLSTLSCSEDPVGPADPTPTTTFSPRDATRPLPNAKTHIDCIDHDGDGFCVNYFPEDCNDDEYFYRPFEGYCLEYDDLILSAHDNWPCADFALYQDAETMHIYYTKGHQWYAQPETDAKSFGHETSYDMLAWEYLRDILPVADGADWEDEFIWAPSVVRNRYDGLYYMFYTGVTDGMVYPPEHKERIGVATSSDLETWTRLPYESKKTVAGDVGPTVDNSADRSRGGWIWDCDLEWTSWDEDCNWCSQCRDAHVFRDEAENCWYMVYTTSLAAPDHDGVVGLARSENLLDWQDLGPLEVSVGWKAESPHVYWLDGVYYLFWTFGIDGGVKYASADDLTGGIWSSPLVVPGSEHSRMIASELLYVNGYHVFAWVRDFDYRQVHFETLRFHADRTVSRHGIPELGCLFVDAAHVHPGAVDFDNGLDDNCNGIVDEGDGECADDDGDFYGDPTSIFCSFFGDDCDDRNSEVHPAARERCDNDLDDNCNGIVNDRAICGFSEIARQRFH